MQESALYDYWQSLAKDGRAIRYNKNTLQVLDAGTLNQARGPDFRQSRFSLNGVVYQGDVECHCRLQDWYQHRHHLDAAYANTLLHIISWQSKSCAPVRHQQSATAIPSFRLPRPQLPQRAPCLVREQDYPFLASMAAAHLEQKRIQFMRNLHSRNFTQLLYEYFLRSLGYSANSNPFQQLASLVPWSRVMEFAGQAGAGSRLFALYAGFAGFLEGSAPEIHDLRNLFRELCPAPDFRPLAAEQWQYAALRPLNHPHFRLAGWVSLLLNRSFNFSCALRDLCGQRLPYPLLYRQIQSWFRVPCGPYWQAHQSLGQPRRGKAPQYYFGRQRIDEFLINTLLPLLMVRARQEGSDGYEAYLEGFYFWLPGHPLYQSLQRNFIFQQKKPPKLAYVQGLIYLNNQYCQAGLCAHCQLPAPAGEPPSP